MPRDVTVRHADEHDPIHWGPEVDQLRGDPSPPIHSGSGIVAKRRRTMNPARGVPLSRLPPRPVGLRDAPPTRRGAWRSPARSRTGPARRSARPQPCRGGTSDPRSHPPPPGRTGIPFPYPSSFMSEVGALRMWSGTGSAGVSSARMTGRRPGAVHAGRLGRRREIDHRLGERQLTLRTSQEVVSVPGGDHLADGGRVRESDVLRCHAHQSAARCTSALLPPSIMRASQ